MLRVLGWDGKGVAAAVAELNMWCGVRCGMQRAGGVKLEPRLGTGLGQSAHSAALEPGMELELLLLLRAEKLLFADTRESRLELIIFADLSHHNSSASRVSAEQELDCGQQCREKRRARRGLPRGRGRRRSTPRTGTTASACLQVIF